MSKVPSWKSLSKSAKETYIVQFVEEAWRFSEKETLPDRQDWAEGYQLFRGIQDWGEDREANPWRNRAFLHQYSKVVRRLASSLSSLIFEKKDFFTLEANDSEDRGSVELARIFQKIIEYDLRRIKFQRLFGDFALHGGITGLGVVKLWVENEVKYRADVILKEIDKAEQKMLDRLGSDVETPIVDGAPDANELDLDIQKGFDELFDLAASTPVGRELGPKKFVEFVIKAAVKNPLNFAWEPNVDYIENSEFHIDRNDLRAYQVFQLFDNGTLDSKRRKDFEKKTAEGTRGTTISSFPAGDFIKSTVKNQYKESSYEGFGGNIEVFEYFGPLIWKDGSIVEERKRYVVGASTLLLDTTNPYYSQKAPFIVSTFSKSPNKASGEGVADGGKEQQKISNDLFSTFLDLLQLCTYAPKVVDDTALREPEELDEGFYPNMLIKTFGGKNANEIISDVPFRADLVAGPLFQTMNKLEASAISGAGVDVQNANQASRARISATEIENNSSHSSDSILNLGRELDETFLEPVIQKIIEYRLQFGLKRESLESLKMSGILNQWEFDIIAGIPPIERYNEVQKSYRVTVKGFRERFERQVTLANMNQFLAQVVKLPLDVQGKVNWSNALEDMVSANGFDGTRWIFQNTPQDKAAEENSLLLNNQQITPGENDDDSSELGVHFSAFERDQTPALIQHTIAHFVRMAELQQPIPSVPDNVLQALQSMVPPEALAQLGIMMPMEQEVKALGE